MKKISSFRDEYRFLSNFYQWPFEYRGLIYPNAEAAFQAQKRSVRAKQMGKKEPNLPANWDETSFDIMRDKKPMFLDASEKAVKRKGEF